ncbi:two-partner secretion domain-containing protein [Halomonas organivorans]|uniref:Filamentous hemagglutinin family protein n=2 Tax=Halomonas organivorans TaxID=257772 RepID=A0A7W5C297_9GAMM|nr:filamentous hemagglutinin N-terminal domain-containing protein [Halomonas organivorans]MBB3143033.1 filamentous hemagglutinin family protein [Halomonas organivorans]
MNHTYRTVWNAARGNWQAVGENVRSTGKSPASCRLARPFSWPVGGLMLVTLPALGSELPSGGHIVGGAGNLDRQGNSLTIRQDSQNLAIEWDDFSIAEHHRVDFVQPNAESSALNRVTGDNVSEIRGALSANGRVFLINPNGISFSSTARVDVGALVASTLDISTEDFMAGRYTFEGGSGNAVINQGNITAAEGGHVAMIAAEIINTGSIDTPRGNTLMGAGSRVTLDLGGPLKIEVEEAALETHIEQGGAIRADGGRVYLTARAANDLASSVINHTGITEARTLASGENGEIMLMGDMDSGSVQVAGTLDASAPAGGDGGFIETSAARVQVADGTTVTTHAGNGDTGTWLIDPKDFTIADSGGDMTGQTVSDALASNDFEIETATMGTDGGNGDILVNDELSWSSANTLTLNAERDIEINREVSITGGGTLALQYGQDSPASGNTASYYVNAPVNLARSYRQIWWMAVRPHSCLIDRLPALRPGT